MFRLASGVAVSDARVSEVTDAMPVDRRVRADAQRNVEALLEAAKAMFATSGVEAPVREIAERAGVGVGTLYRHFPKRSDLIAAVFRREIDACADAALALAEAHRPFEALAAWIQRFAGFVATKRGLAPALHSGDPAYESLRGYFERRVRPALKTLFASAAAAGEVRGDVDPNDIISAIFCMSGLDGEPEKTKRLVALFVDGLRYGAPSAAAPK